MLKNYIKIAFRNLRKQKMYSLINILGLAIGISCCIVIYLFVRHEYSYDHFHDKADRIYRIQDVNYESVEASQAEPSFFDTRAPEGVSKSAFLPLPMGPVIKDRYPEIRHFVRYDESDALLRNEEKVFEESVSYAEPTFFEMFSFDLLKGNPETALSQKNNVVLTPEIARKYFGSDDPVGQVLQIKIRDEEQPFTVSGVVDAPPTNSSLQFQVLLPIENKPFFDNHIENWNSFNTALFVELVPGADTGEFKKKLNAFYAERYEGSMEQARQRKNMPEDATVMEFTLTPLTDIHLDASVPWSGTTSNPLYSYILGGIAILILLIACINYVTLTLTRSTGRAREVGIRKVAGAHRSQIAWQFWGETQLVTLLAMISGLGLAELLLPVFNQISGKSLSIEYAGGAGFLTVILGITAITGLIAGSYPALFLARFRPAEILKGTSTRRFKPHLTKGLLIFQYSLSVFLIISSVVMVRQMNYVSQKDLGYNEDQVLVIPTYTGWTEEGTRLMERFRNELTAVPGIDDVSGMAPAFTTGSNRYGFKVNGEFKDSFIYYVDEQFVETMGMQLTAGRNFSEDRPSDEAESIIINQALAESMGWEDPVGEQLPWKGEENPSTVIGIAKDFHFESLEAPIQPMLLHMDPEHGGINNVLVKIEQGQIAQALPRLETKWGEVAPLTPFDYWFLDDAVAQQYQSYKRWQDIMASSTAIAILIACLGLFGLAGISVVNRTKEIGIRKVLGAGIRQIILLLNKDIVKLILISLAIAAPVSWYIMEQWLADFAYRIEIGAGVFLVSAAVALAIAIMTVSYHSVKAALINPVESLRNE